jgi:hypothetical protein
VSRRSIAKALLAAHLATLGACAGPRASVAADPAFEAELVALMRTGIETKAPNTSEHLTRGRPTAFDGSYDWHSCVIAHVALSISARVRGDGELEAWLAPRLSADVLAAESALIVEPDPFTRPTWPYDEAWFCLLLAERARSGTHTGSGTDPLDDLRRTHERRLVEALEVLPFPDPFTYRSDPRLAQDGVEPARRELFGPVCGFYRSWLWAFVALGWCEPLDDDVRARHLALWHTRVEPLLPELLAGTESHGYDFLWVPALAALAADAVGRPVGRGAVYAPPPLPALPDAVVVATVHPLGVFLSQGWPAAAGLAERADTSAWTERRETLRARRDLWAQDFDACSHWLPQYLFVGEWLAAGRP